MHGVTTAHDVFRLPDRWQLQLSPDEGALSLGQSVRPIRPGHVSLVPPNAEVHCQHRIRRYNADHDIPHGDIVIERTMSWLCGCRRVHRRYERKAEHFLTFTAIACSLICYRRLTKRDDVQAGMVRSVEALRCCSLPGWTCQ